jgi:hypothetical protein
MRRNAQMPTNYRKYTNVVVDKATVERIRNQGKAGTSLCDVIKSLLNEQEKKQQKR